VNSPAAGGTSSPSQLLKTTAVIGAGRAGRAFAFLCARRGHRVILEDVMPANLRHAQQELAQLGPVAISGTLELAGTIEAAVREADLIVDFVPDELESKLEIFCLIDRMAPPKTLLLTPSENLSITDLASCTYRSDHCFAVRGAFGEIQHGGAVRLLYPAATNEASLNSVAGFLRELGASVQVEPDQDAPMLVKNQR